MPRRTCPRAERACILGASREGLRLGASSLEDQKVKVSIRGALGVALLLAGGAATGLRGQAPATFIVESPTMTTGRFMPRDYTPDGRNLSPPLSWRGLPAGTRQLAVISQDYGAGRPPPWVLTAAHLVERWGDIAE